MCRAIRAQVFVGSSSEGHRVALAVQENLSRCAEVTVWNQDFFKPSSFTLESLLEGLNQFDYGIFVFSPDDPVTIRGKHMRAVRDNVVLELGLFMGRLGRCRTFVVAPLADKKLRQVSDLLGVTFEDYDPSSPNLVANLGPACSRIARAIQQANMPGGADEKWPSLKALGQWYDTMLATLDPAHRAIAGCWKGTAQPVEPPGHPAFDIEYEFTVLGRLVRGCTRFKSLKPGRGVVVNECIGGFVSNDYLKLDHKKHDGTSTGPGSEFFRLSADGLELEGSVIGYSSNFEQLFFTKVRLRKVV